MLPEPRAGRRPRAGGGRDAGTDETARDWHRAESEPQGWERPGLRRQRGATEKSNKAAEPFTDPRAAAHSHPYPGRSWHSLGSQPAGLGWAGLASRMAQAATEADGVRRGPDPRPTGEWLGLSVLGSPPTAPPPRPNLPPLGPWLGKQGKKKQPLRQASVSTSCLSLWLSFPANGTHCLLPAWLWQRPGCRGA